MTRAVVEYVEHRGPQPPELEKLAEIRYWNALPRAGGLLDQPAGLLQKLQYADRLYHAWKGWTETQDPENWKKENPGDWPIVKAILSTRRSNG